VAYALKEGFTVKSGDSLNADWARACAGRDAAAGMSHPVGGGRSVFPLFLIAWKE